MRVAIYSRESTVDEAVSAEQSKNLREYANVRGWAVVIDIQEGRGERCQRREGEKCLAAAHQRLIDKVQVLSLDRWSVGRVLASLSAPVSQEKKQ